MIPLAGRLLHAVAVATGARVTSWARSEEENARVGGRAGSLHLSGMAVDLGADSSGVSVQVVKAFAERGGWDPEGTAPHWHFEAGPRTVLLVSAALLAVVSFIKGRS